MWVPIVDVCEYHIGPYCILHPAIVQHTSLCIVTMAKRKLGTRADTIDVTNGPYLESSLKTNKWQKRGKLQKMPQPKQVLSTTLNVTPAARLQDDDPMYECSNIVHEDLASSEDGSEKLPVRSKVRNPENFVLPSF